VQRFFASVFSKELYFGDGNWPGYPKPLLLVGKFASAGCARSPLSAMSQPTSQQPPDVMTLNMLPTFIINAYQPGDTVLIAMNQPVSLCIGHQDLVSLVIMCTMICCFVWFCQSVVVDEQQSVTFYAELIVVSIRLLLKGKPAFASNLLKSHCKHYVGDVCSGPCCFTVM
jgi:hypothetical protein